MDWNDADNIAWRPRQILKDDGLRGRMGAKSREIALGPFHEAKVAQRTREVYLRAIQPGTKVDGVPHL